MCQYTACICIIPSDDPLTSLFPRQHSYIYMSRGIDNFLDVMGLRVRRAEYTEKFWGATPTSGPPFFTFFTQFLYMHNFLLRLSPSRLLLLLSFFVLQFSLPSPSYTCINFFKKLREGGLCLSVGQSR